MKLDDSAIEGRGVAVGTGLAALAVLAFSFSFPATVWSLSGFGAWTSSGLRGLFAGIVAAICLKVRGVPLPTRAQWPGLFVVAGGCVVGFPYLTTLALRTSSTAHSAVVVGLLPIATAVVSSISTRRRQPKAFWLASGIGALAVLVFTITQSGAGLSIADLFLFAALIVCAFGYAEGGRLAAQLPGWQVIAWALVIALPFSAWVSVAAVANEHIVFSAKALLGLGYIALISQFGGFFAWYRGMAEIGVAKASQLQLAQPLLTLAWAVLLLGEHLPLAALVTAIMVIACIVATQRTRDFSRN